MTTESSGTSSAKSATQSLEETMANLSIHDHSVVESTPPPLFWKVGIHHLAQKALSQEQPPFNSTQEHSFTDLSKEAGSSAAMSPAPAEEPSSTSSSSQITLPDISLEDLEESDKDSSEPSITYLSSHSDTKTDSSFPITSEGREPCSATMWVYAWRSSDSHLIRNPSSPYFTKEERRKSRETLPPALLPPDDKPASGQPTLSQEPLPLSSTQYEPFSLLTKEETKRVLRVAGHRRHDIELLPRGPCSGDKEVSEAGSSSSVWPIEWTWITKLIADSTNPDSQSPREAIASSTISHHGEESTDVRSLAESVTFPFPQRTVFLHRARQALVRKPPHLNFTQSCFTLVLKKAAQQEPHKDEGLLVAAKSHPDLKKDPAVASTSSNPSIDGTRTESLPPPKYVAKFTISRHRGTESALDPSVEKAALPPQGSALLPPAQETSSQRPSLHNPTQSCFDLLHTKVEEGQPVAARSLSDARQSPDVARTSFNPFVDGTKSESQSSQKLLSDRSISSDTGTESPLSSRSESSSPCSLTQWKIAQRSSNPNLTRGRLRMSANRSQGACTKKEWLELLTADWAKNTPKGPLAKALLLTKLMTGGATEGEFCDFIRDISRYFYQGEREGLKEEAAGIYRDLRAKFLRGSLDPFYELVVQPTLCSLSGGLKALLSLYREEASRGNPGLLFTLARFCMQGWESGKRDEDEARRLYQQAADQGHPGAFYSLSQILQEEESKKQNAPESGVDSKGDGGGKDLLKTFREAATEGDPEAQFTLAALCFNGWESGKRDADEAIRLYKLAAAQGHRQALDRLVWLQQQEKTSENPAINSMLYIKRAADLGHMEAQGSFAHFQLANSSSYHTVDYSRYPRSSSNRLWIFAKDDYTTYYQSSCLYQRGAFGGNHFAQCAFARCYEMGIGVSQNVGEAIKWYEKSAAFGNQEASEALNRLRSAKQETLSSALPLENEEREKRLATLASDWKNNLGLLGNLRLLGNVERNGQILVTLFQKEKVTAQDFADFFAKIDSIDRKGSWTLSLLHEKFKRLAESDALNPEYALGQCYNHGFGVPENEEQGFKLCLKAATQGNTEAQSDVGKSLCSGIGAPYSPEKGIEWLKKAADQGNPEAFFALGQSYERGIGVETNLEKAELLYKLSADRGHLRALLTLGQWYENGTGVTTDHVAAVRLYTQLANQGYPVGLCALGRCYGYGIGVEKNPPLAAEYFRKAAERGDLEAKNFYSMYISSLETLHEILCEKPLDEALRYLIAAAEAGHPAVQLELGLIYKRGAIVERDLQKADSFFQKAEESGDPEILTALGKMYEEGNGFPKDLVKAEQLYRPAALKGEPEAKKALIRLNKGFSPIDLSSTERPPL